MKQTNSQNHLDWIKKADEDELNVLTILKYREGTASMVCYLSQQIVEKYLKALLVYHKIFFSKVHDLLQLQTLLIEVVPEIRDYNKVLDLLSTYYFETRYPGDYPDFSWKDAEEAYAAAKEIKKFVLEKIQ